MVLVPRSLTRLAITCTALLVGLAVDVADADAINIKRDLSFGKDGITRLVEAESDFSRLTLAPGGSIYVGGSENDVRRLHPGGGIDKTWGRNGRSPYRTLGDFSYPGEVDLVPGGGVLMPSMSQPTDDESLHNGFVVIKLGKNGLPDESFGKHAMIGRSAFALPLDITATATDVRKDGQIYLTGGYGTLEGGSGGATLTLLRPDGTVNERFGRKGRFRLPGKLYPFALKNRNVLTEFTDVIALADGGALVSGVVGPRVVITRVDRRGRPVRNFGGRGHLLSVPYGGMSGIASASYFGNDSELKMHRSANRKWFYLLAQGTGRNKVIAFNRRGRLKRNFGEAGVAEFGRRKGRPWSFNGYSLELLPGGKIAVGGLGGGDGGPEAVMALLNADGTVDQNFGEGGYLTRQASGLQQIIDLEVDRRGGLVAVGDPLGYVPPDYPDEDGFGGGGPRSAWVVRFTL